MLNVPSVRQKIIYLDNNATTPCLPEVQEAINTCMHSLWGNASSQHYIGRQAHKLLEESREKVAFALGCRKSEVFFNSGATEGNNWIFLSLLKSQPQRKKIVVSSIEHKSVLLSARELKKFNFEIVELPVTSQGMVDLSSANDLITDETALVSCQYANNETGVIQPIAELSSIAHCKGALFHCDAVQGFGKTQLNLNELEIDAATFSAHKIHGPQGVGALFLKDSGKAWPYDMPFAGGGQEHEIRPGTHNLPGIVGFATAAEHVISNLSKRIKHFSKLQTLLENELLAQIPGCIIHGKSVPRIPNTTNVSIPEISSDILMTNMPLFCVSNGSACNSGVIGISYVLNEMNIPIDVAETSIRISTSINTSETEIKFFLSELLTFLSSCR